MLAPAAAAATVRFVDASTGLDVGRSLSISAEGVSLVRDRQGLLLVTREVCPEGDAAGDTADEGVDLLVADPSGHYLPRRFLLTLRRDLVAQIDAAGPRSVRPVCVAMFLTSAARPGPGCAVVRVRITEAATHRPLGGALVRVTGRAAGRHPRVLGRGLSDARGDALIAMRATPAAIWEGKPGRGALTPELSVDITAAVDPNAPQDGAYVPDPDVLDARLERGGSKGAGPEALATATAHQKIWWGRELSVRLSIVLG